jgi:hypothetical protein
MDINAIARLATLERIVNIQLTIVKAIHANTERLVLINLKDSHANAGQDLLDFSVRLKLMSA